MFSVAEINFIIGDCKLLVIKLALEKWNHPLEEAHHLIIIYKDHKNLLYRQTAQRFNLHQIRWTLFSHFKFLLHFGPAEKNVKADALSRLSDSSDQVSESQFIVDPDRLIPAAPIQLRQIPPENTFIPQFLSWRHSSKLAGHPELVSLISCYRFFSHIIHLHGPLQYIVSD